MFKYLNANLYGLMLNMLSIGHVSVWAWWRAVISIPWEPQQSFVCAALQRGLVLFSETLTCIRN